MADWSDPSRREVLALLGVSGVGGLAGCGSGDGPGRPSETTERATDETSPGTATPTAAESTTEPGTEESPADTPAPTITGFDLTTTDTVGTLQYELAVTAESRIAGVTVTGPNGTLVRLDDPGTSVEDSGTVTVEPGGERAVTLRVEDATGNSTEATRRAYARQFPVLAEPSHDIGAIYRPAVGGEWDDCIDGVPAVGTYDTPPSGSVVDGHRDQAGWAGIDRWVVEVRDPRQLRGLDALTEGSLAGTVASEIALDPHGALTGGSFERLLSATRDRIESVPAYASRDGRPVVSVAGLGEYDDDRDGFYPHPNVTSAFETAGAFVDQLREALTVDGTAPYLVGGLGVRSMHNYETNLTEPYRAFASRFDALFQDPYDPGEGRVPWDAAFEENYERLFAGRRLADDLGIGFEPVVFPGWDHTVDTCSDSAEVIPRAPAHLAAFLRAADLFGTTGRVRINSFNDWRRGTQIESGRVGGESYGTSFLESVRTFQSDATDRDFYGRSEYYVAPEGSDTNPGSEARPLATIQHALARARPGDTIRVRPGRYTESAETRRAGTGTDPITITGPADAVFSAYGGLNIEHSHVHLTGLTFDGLVDPDAPEDPESYAQVPITLNQRTRDATEEEYADGVPRSAYLTDVVVEPHAVGNCRAAMIKHQYADDVEIGGFRVIGPAGLKFTLGDVIGHNSEIVYLGTPPGKDAPPDRSRNIRVHHIDNSAGYAHAELVDCKTGTSAVTVEYCTDAGGAYEAISDGGSAGAVVIGGTDITVRWNDISDSAAAGVEIAADIAATADPPAAYADGGTDNAIYGNRLLGNAGAAIDFPYAHEGQAPTDQRVVCGNTYDGETGGDPDAPCGEAVPTGDGIGHLGGDSPWT